MSDSKQQLEEDLKLLQQGPSLLRLARDLHDYLPDGKLKRTLRSHVSDVRNDLIKLDVLLQDIQWSFSEARVKKIFEMKSKRNSV